MKLTKTAARKALRSDYIDALAYFAGFLSDEDPDSWEDVLDDLDDRLWDWCENWGSREQETWLRVWTGLKIYA